MTHKRETAQKTAELSAAFLLLNDKGRDSALTILRTLDFAQSVMSTKAGGGRCAGRTLIEAFSCKSPQKDV